MFKVAGRLIRKGRGSRVVPLICDMFMFYLLVTLNLQNVIEIIVEFQLSSYLPYSIQISFTSALSV